LFLSGLSLALAALAAGAAVTGQSSTVSASSPKDGENRELAQPQSPGGDGAIYLHTKVMKVGTSRSGVPVLRFVECRHYPRNHNKLVQTNVSAAGQAVLRFMPGDYCLFASDESVSGTDTPNPQSDASRNLLTAYQRYACEKFGSACAIALAIQLAENPKGTCEVYHYNPGNGTLDWGFFQINTVHLKRPGLNLKDLLDCKANIDFAFELFREKGFEAWSTYASGSYRKFLARVKPQLLAAAPAPGENIPFSLAQPR
jgi:hypothetical protein